MKNLHIRVNKQREELDEMEILRLKRHFQITIPLSLREKLGLSIGDYLEADVEDGKIVIRPVKVIHPDQEYFFTKEWQEAEAKADKDIAEDRVSGPFATAEEVLKALKNSKE